MAHFRSENDAQVLRKLATVTSADLNDETFRRKVVESSIEIRELESKLKAAYVMKERHQQVIEKELYKSKEKESARREAEWEERRLELANELEEQRLLYEKWKKERYCLELIDQAAECRMLRDQELAEQRRIDEQFLREVVLRELEREQREREERVVKKRRLAEDLKRCVELQRQWQTIQKLIEAEEERIAEECRVQRHRLSQMQQQQRRDRAAKLTAIRARLGNALATEERRRREREQLWIEFAYEEKDEAAERREEDALRQRAARKEELRRTVHQQMDELQRRRQRQQEEKHFQHLLAMERAALEQRAAEEEKARLREGQTRLQQEQEAQLQDRQAMRRKEMERRAEEERRDAERQRAEDAAVAEERRRILEQHAPLLMEFLPASVLRDVDDLRVLPASLQAQFQPRARLQDDPDLW